MAEELKDDSFVGITANNLSFLFEKMQQYNKSEAFGRQALSLGIKTRNQGQIARAYGNIAGVFEHIKKYDSAISYYNNAIKVFKEENDVGALATAYNDVGFVYRENNNNEMGLSSYKKAYELATGLGNESDRSFYAANIGSVLLELKQSDEAFRYL